MLELNWSNHLKEFKKLIGLTNHHLITILIGLEGVRVGKVTKNDSFHVFWNPNSVEDSVRTSRIFARNAALSWGVDALDAYLGFLKRKPFNLPQNLKDKLSSRSIYSNLNDIIEFANYKSDLPLALVHMGIQWRNNLVHFHAANDLDMEFSTIIRNTKKEEIKERFRGLDPQLMYENFKDNKSPALKEVAAIIQSIHYLVLELDKQLIKYIDLKVLIDDILTHNDIEMNNIISANKELRLRKFNQFLISKGFKKSISDESITIKENELEKILNDYITIRKKEVTEDNN